MTNPLHDYIARQIVEKLKNRALVVFYDPRKEFPQFFLELHAKATPGMLDDVVVAELPTKMAEYSGSFFEIRSLVESSVSSDNPQPLLIYLPGVERDRRGSVLMEVELSGECYEPQLKRLARNVLRQKYTDGVIDELLASENVSYEDLARASSAAGATEAPSLLKTIFHEISGSEAILASWLTSDSRDNDIEAKDARAELIKLLKSRIGFELVDDVSLAKLRSAALRYVLGTEFRSDLRCPPPTSLDSVPVPKTKEDESAVRALARKLRESYADEYAPLADLVEAELGLQQIKVPGAFLGSIDTFRFEERALLIHCGELICELRFADALNIVNEREKCYWLDRDVARRSQWEACRLMVELGALAVEVTRQATTEGDDPRSWVEHYTSKSGWYRLDQAQRRLETWIANLEDEPDEKPLGIIRRVYDDACQAMAKGFSQALQKTAWTISDSMHQTKTFVQAVDSRPTPVAYFLVDAMRFEMGQEFVERFPSADEVSIRAAVGSLPSITPIGMAALMPGASGSFNVVSKKDKLGVVIDGEFLSDVVARKKFIAAHVPGLVDISLDELLSLQRSKLEKRLKNCTILVVRSQEIDHAGEGGFTFQARQVMDTVIDNLARAIRKLSTAGIEQSVISADHGHLFFQTDRDESMKIDAPGGQTVELHRRCWIGRGGMTPAGCVRVAAASLGYDSDLEFVFPLGVGVFRAGGDLAYHHGGISLQEMIVPVITVRLKAKSAPLAAAAKIIVGEIPTVITNRIFSVTLQPAGTNLSLFAGPAVVRPLLSHSGKQVGAVGMAIGADHDRETGYVKLDPTKAVTIAFVLNESAPSVNIVIQDPETDAVLFHLEKEIPVRLGI